MIKDIEVYNEASAAKRILPSRVMLYECTFFLLFGFLLSRVELIGIVNTFGIAWVITAFLSGRVPIFAAVGAIAGLASALGQTSSLTQFASQIAIVAGEYMVLFAAKRIFKGIKVIPFIALGAGFYCLCEAILLLIDGFNVFNLLFVLLNTVTIGFSGYVFDYVLRIGKKHVYSDISKPDMLLMLFLVVLSIAGIGSIALWSVELRVLFSYFFIFTCSYLYGVGAGALAGVICGIIIGFSSGMYDFSPIIPFAICGIIPGLAKHLHKFIIAGIILVFYVAVFYLLQENYSSIHFFIEIAIASVLFAIIPFDAVALLRETVISVNNTPYATKTYAERVKSVCSEKITSVKNTSSRMHSILQDYLKEAEEQCLTDCSALEATITETVCTHCTLGNSCAFANRKGKRNPDCKVAELVGRINHVSGLWQNRMSMFASIPTIAVGCLNDSMKDVQQSIESTVHIETLLTSQVEQALIKSMNIVSGAVVTCNGYGYEVLIELKTEGISQSEINRIKSICEEAVDVHLDSGVCGNGTVLFAERSRFMLSTGFANVSFDPDGICGDASTIMRYGDNGFMLAVADGCGTGYPALKESSMVMELLEVLAGCGCDEKSMLSLINLLMGLRMDNESYSTADVCVFNKFNGNAKFLKMGAVCSYIVHNGDVSIVNCGASPLGVTDEATECIQDFRLRHNDAIVMMTDGVYDSCSSYRNPDEYFVDMLREIKFANAQEAANEILERASKNLKRIKDDMLVVVAIVRKIS